MQVLIDGHSYSFSEDVLSHNKTREGYFNLAKTIYKRLDFGKWYQSGYWDNKFIPYVLFDGDMAVSSVGICINDVLWQNTNKSYVQISTVMTLPEYRNKGLNRWLLEYVITKWKDKCNSIYLLANDSVVDFYPKFGFEKFTEYEFTVPVRKIDGEFRKLNISDSNDLELLIKKYEISNPFTELKVKNFSQFIFHCMHFVSDDIYYLGKYDTVAIVQYDGKKLECYDIFTDSNCQLSEILGIFANDETEYAYLGFTPKPSENCSVIESQEEDNHLFVLSGKENIFKNNKVMFQLLSRA